MSGFDYSKLATFIESFQPLAVRDVLRCVALFRSDLRQKYDDINPNHELHAMVSLDSPWIEAAGRWHLGSSIASILKTPRALKSALRRVRSAWLHLHGEIDFDDLLLVCVLRESDRMIDIHEVVHDERVCRYSVNVFELFARHVHWLRHHLLRESRWDKRESEFDKPDAEQSELLGVIASNHAEGQLIEVLVSIERFGQRTWRPQSVSAHGPVDYWSRILAEEIPENEERDQVVLRFLDEFRERGTEDSKAAATLVDWIIASDLQAHKVVHFAPFIGGDRMHSLADVAIQKIVERYPDVPSDDRSHVGGLIELGRMFRWHLHDHAKRLDTVRRGIAAAMKKSLTLSHGIEYWLVMRPLRDTPGPTDSDDDRASIADHVRESFIQTFSDEKLPDLISVVDNPFVLSWMIRRRWEKRDMGAPEENPAAWSPAAKVLLDAAEAEPQIVGVALAISLATDGELRHTIEGKADERRSSHRWDVEFDEHFAEQFLGDEFNRAMHILAAIDVSGLEGETFGYVSAVVNYARRKV